MIRPNDEKQRYIQPLIHLRYSNGKFLEQVRKLYHKEQTARPESMSIFWVIFVTIFRIYRLMVFFLFFLLFHRYLTISSKNGKPTMTPNTDPTTPEVRTKSTEKPKKSTASISTIWADSAMRLSSPLERFHEIQMQPDRPAVGSRLQRADAPIKVTDSPCVQRLINGARRLHIKPAIKARFAVTLCVSYKFGIVTTSPSTTFPPIGLSV
jgi:cytoskeletal protein RodZ